MESVLSPKKLTQSQQGNSGFGDVLGDEAPVLVVIDQNKHLQQTSQTTDNIWKENEMMAEKRL